MSNSGNLDLQAVTDACRKFGVRRLELFGSAVRDPDTTIGPILKQSGKLNKQLKLLWFQCGIDDFLLNDNRKFASILTERGIRHGYKETAGNHSWPVWRKYLAEYLPIVFKG